MTSRKPDHLVALYSQIRLATENLVASLSPEDCQIQSMPDASPTKWHLAHTSWFFETFLLLPHSLAIRPLIQGSPICLIHTITRWAIASLVRSRGLMSRPTLDEVRGYRRLVDQAMFDLLLTLPDDLIPIVDLGLNHEQQHQELILTDIKHGFAQNPLRPRFAPTPPPPAQTASSRLELALFLKRVFIQSVSTGRDSHSITRHHDTMFI